MSGDFIVGFPGETEEDFEATLDTGPRGRLCLAPFPSNIRRGPARRPPSMATRCPDEVKADRLHRLQALLHGPADRPSTPACVGRTLPVLLEKPGRQPGQLVGRSPYLQAVHVDGRRPGLSATIVDTRYLRCWHQQPFGPYIGPSRDSNDHLEQRRQSPLNPPVSCGPARRAPRPAPGPKTRRHPHPHLRRQSRCCRCSSASMTSIWR